LGQGKPKGARADSGPDVQANTSIPLIDFVFVPCGSAILAHGIPFQTYIVAELIFWEQILFNLKLSFY
jgi:hypothetical protein